MWKSHPEFNKRVFKRMFQPSHGPLLFFLRIKQFATLNYQALRAQLNFLWRAKGIVTFTPTDENVTMRVMEKVTVSAMRHKNAMVPVSLDNKA